MYKRQDHDRAKFEKKKVAIQQAVDYLNQRYPEGTVKLELKDQYFNMKEMVEPVIHVVDNARKAMEDLEIKPLVVPIRGGTDGSRLSYMGLPCPNIFAGGHNFHGKYEYVCLDSMVKATQVILKIIDHYTNA